MGGPETPKDPVEELKALVRDLLKKPNGHELASKSLRDKVKAGEITKEEPVYVESLNKKEINRATIYKNKSGVKIAIVYHLHDGTQEKVILYEAPKTTYGMQVEKCDPNDKPYKLRAEIKKLKAKIDADEVHYNRDFSGRNWVGDGNLMDNWVPFLEELLLNYKKLIACDIGARDKIKEEVKDPRPKGRGFLTWSFAYGENRMLVCLCSRM